MKFKNSKGNWFRGFIIDHEFYGYVFETIVFKNLI